MGYDLAVPEYLRELGRALQPLGQRLRVELATQAVATTVVADPIATLARHFDGLPQRIEVLALRVRDLNDDVAANPQADAGDVRRAVGRLAECIDDLVCGLRNARTLRSDGSAAEMPATGRPASCAKDTMKSKSLLAGSKRPVAADPKTSSRCTP